MKMTFVDPQGNKTVAAPADSNNIPVVNIQPPVVSKSPQQIVPNTQSSADISRKLVSAEEFRKFIEVEVLKIIKDLAEKGVTPKERIQAIAQQTLNFIKPEMTLETLYQNAVKLDDQYSELCPVVFKVMREYEEKYEKKALTQVSLFIRQGQYDEAQNLVKKVLQFKIGE